MIILWCVLGYSAAALVIGGIFHARHPNRLTARENLFMEIAEWPLYVLILVGVVAISIGVMCVALGQKIGEWSMS